MSILKLSEVLFPHFGATAKQSPKQRYGFYLFSSWLVISTSVALFAPIIPLAEGVMTFTIGSEVGNQSSSILRTLAIASILGCGSNVFTTCAMGLGKSKTIASIISIHSIATVICTAILISLFGVVAAGMGLAAANLLRLMIAIRYSRKELFDFAKVSELFVSVLLPIIICTTSALAIWMTYSNTYDSLLELAAHYGLFSLFFLTISVAATATTVSGRILLKKAYLTNPLKLLNQKET